MIEIKMPKEREEVKGDLISRQAVIYYIKPYIQEIITESGVDKNEHTNRMLRAIINGIETMPTGKQQPCEDAISRADVKKYLSAPDANGDRIIYESDLDLLPSVTPKAEQKAVLDKIRAEILDEAEYAYADFDRYKEDILYAEPDELPDDDFRYGLERAAEIINKYKAESEDKE